MVIFDGELDESAYEININKVTEGIAAESGTVHSTDKWGKRRFAYEIAHKTEGWYVVLQVTTAGSGFPDLERQLRLADAVVRHKLFRLPDGEATKRGLIGQATPA
jgi:small subunit ribosomal protein S6